MQKSGVPGSRRRRIFRRDGYRCQVCGLIGREVRFDRGGYGYPTEIDGVYLSIDHIVPKSLGGFHEEANLRCLCTTCNTGKGTKSHA